MLYAELLSGVFNVLSQHIIVYTQIFVWSISENCKVNSIRYRNSIISLSFQPHGPFIAIASGTELRLWNWAEHANLCIDGPTGNIIQSKSRPDKAFDATATPSRQYPSMKVIFHQRNIRAVLFHPYGKILLAAAPDYSKSKNASYNRLYAFDIDSIAIPPGDPIDQESDGHMLSLSTLPSLLPQVHLYSDGGLDISSDGQFLFVCSILFEGKAVDSTLDALTQRLTAMSLSTDDDFSTQQLVSIDPDTVDAAGLAPIPCLCLYKFNFPVECSTKINDKVPESAIGFRNAALYDIPYPQLELIRHNQLSSSLLKAITSVKLSPACRYGLLGYGVRNEGYVESHIYGYVASEIVSLWDQKLPIVAAMTDEVDEVNIAQFHPLPGGGIIYGTKRGRVRVFKRTSIIKG